MKKRVILAVAMVLVLMLIGVVGCFTNSELLGRPYFGSRQVMTPAEIHEGDCFIRVHKDVNLSWMVVKVVREPYVYCYEDPYGCSGTKTCGRVIDVLYVKDDGTPRECSCADVYCGREQLYLTDAGVIPYETGGWNPSNAMLKIDMSELTPASVEKIMIDDFLRK